MTKRRKRRRHEKTLKRRELLKKATVYTGLGLAGVVLATGGVSVIKLLIELSEEEPARKLYERGYELESEPKRIGLGTGTDFLTKRNEEEFQKEARLYIIRRRGVSDPSDPKKLWAPIDYKINAQTKEWILFEPDTEYGERIIRLSREALEHSLGFWKSPFLIPLVMGNIRFFIPRRKEDVSFDAEENEAIIYVCYGYDIEKVVKVSFPYGKSEETYTRTFRERPHGGTRRGMSFEKETVKISYRPIFFALRGEPVYIVETSPVEVLHHQLSGNTGRNIVQEVNDVLKQRGSTDNDERERIMKKWAYREEVLTHAIGKLWLEAYNTYRKLGFRKGELESKSYGPDTSKAVELAERIKSIGIGNAIELYATGPERLFS